MKNIFYILLLLPTIIFAQYPSNSGQKITLGEQTTADGLVWRGRTSDTANLMTNKLDTSVYLVLDTMTEAMWLYRVTTTPKWNRVVDSLNNMQGTLSVAKGGTGQTTPTAALNALLQTQSQSTTIGATLKSNGTNSYWDNFSAAGTVQDQSGNFYNTVAIGTQVWFKENLRTKKYRSGALIPIKTNTDTSTLVGQMYYYNNDSLTNYSVYGALYNWRATQNSDSLCPVGWHVPTDAEWTTLTTYLGGESVAGGKMKATGTTYWNSPNTGVTNESGFSALPGGYRSNDGSFTIISSFAFFWSATENGSSLAWIRYLGSNFGSVIRSSNISLSDKSVGASVRCLRNTPANNLSSDFTGTLPVANGGTNTTTLTANKVMVGNGTSGVLTPTNLHWDNTNSRLGIGLSNPTVALDVSAPKVQFRLTSTTGTNAGYALFANSGTNFYFGIDGNTGQDFDNTFSNSAVLWNGGATPMLFATSNIRRMIITSGGNVGIGTGSPGDILPPSWTSSSTDRLLQIETGGAGGSSGLLLRRGDEITGLDVWNDGQINAFSYIDDRWDNAASALNFRMRTKGTPVNAMTIKGSGNVGIGTASPSYKLHIKPSSSGRTFHDTRMLMTIESSSEAYYNVNIPSNGYGGFRVHATPAVDAPDASFEFWAPNKRFHFYSTGYFAFNGKGNNEYFKIDSTGYIGIGTTAPAVQLHTTGGVRFATFAGGGTTTLSVDNTGNLARTSSIELKKDVIPINYGLNEILQINPINFNWIDEDKFGNENENGFIAEDVMSIIPNVVAVDTHGLFMDYTKLIPILTKAIQEQQALIKALEQRILTLENK